MNPVGGMNFQQHSGIRIPIKTYPDPPPEDPLKSPIVSPRSSSTQAFKISVPDRRVETLLGKPSSQTQSQPQTTWTSRIDPKTSKPFFHNAVTGKSVWTLPPGEKAAPLILSSNIRQQESNFLQNRYQQTGVIGDPGRGYPPYNPAGMTRPRPIPRPPPKNPNGLIGENGTGVPPSYIGRGQMRHPPTSGLIGEEGRGVPPNYLIGENGRAGPQNYLIGENGRAGPQNYLIGENGRADPRNYLIGENGRADPRNSFVGWNPENGRPVPPGSNYKTTGISYPTLQRINQQRAMMQRYNQLLQNQRRAQVQAIRNINSSRAVGNPMRPVQKAGIINPDSMKPISSSSIINPDSMKPISQKLATQAFDIRKIASQGTLAPFIDKRSVGINQIHEHNSGITSTLKIIKYAPLVTKILIPGLFWNLHWVLPQGCWLLRYTPAGAPSSGWLTYHMDGTMRIQHTGSTSVKMSGDLYSHLKINLPWFKSSKEPNPGAGKVPIFRRSSYNSYLRVTAVSMAGSFNKINVEFQRHSLDSSNNWVVDSGYTSTMTRQTLPSTSAYPHKNRYFVGNVYQSNICVAHLTMGWICPQYRDIVLELDSVTASPIPTTTSSGFTWNTLFNDVNYGANVVCSDLNLPEASGQSWNSSELHQAMLNNREKDNLDKEWRYHLMFCRRLDMTDRGIMFDNGSTDSNNTPREGAATASHWVFPSGWGNVSGQTFHTTDGYLRTAIHELGHAFNLLHNSSGTNFMRVTPSINAAATASQPFPTNVTWSYSASDLDRLRHWPDPVVRPGGLEFAAMPYSSIPISDADDPLMLPSPNLELDISPLRATVPLGAPVRFKVTCKNTSDESVPGPRVLSLANPNFRGGVSSLSNNDGSANHFSSIFKCNDGCHDGPTVYEAGQTRNGNLTLIRGSNGPLFSSPGMHRVFVEVSWIMEPNADEDSPGIPVRFISMAECTVMISPPRSPAGAQQALTVLSCPNLLPAFVFGTPLSKLDPSTRTALNLAMKAPELRSHFSVLRSRWYRASRAAARGESLQMEEDAVMTEGERLSVNNLFRAASAPIPTPDLKQ